MGCGVSGATGSPSASYTPNSKDNDEGGKLPREIFDKLPPDVKEAIVAAGMAPDDSGKPADDPADIKV